MTTTHLRPHRLTRIALVTAVAIFSAGGCLSFFGGGYSSGSSDSGSANHSLDDQLLEAASNGDLASIRDLLARGADIDARDDYGWTALMVASESGEVAAVELLLDRGADIDARDDYGGTALMEASAYGGVAAVELLLDRGADIEAREDGGWTALMMASEKGQVETAELLLNRGADIEARKDSGWTVLMSASAHGGVAAVELLLDRGADIYARRDDGWTALMWASAYGQVAAVELLLDRGADIYARNEYGKTALAQASEKGHDEVAAVLRAWAAQFFEAASNGDVTFIEDVLDRGADIEARNDNGLTALMLASWEGQVAAVELLLDRGADIDARDRYGDTALIWASRKGHDEVAAVLRAWAAEPGGRQDTRPALAQSQESAPAAQAPRPSTPRPAEQNKTALLIANAGYDHLPKLRTPIQEARQLGAALKRIGFEVQLLTDGSEDEMRQALYRFEERVRERGGTALFHYGGHGVQVNGVNYLLPVDRNIPDERRVRSLAISADEISGALQAARSSANIVILDACRDNPLPRETRSTDVRGLAPVNNPPPNTLIVFAADGGQVARDGLFTPALLRYIEQPGIEITAMLRQVRRDVLEASGGTQRTANYDQLVTEVYLAGGAR